jgi:hypothetical protein
MIAIIIRTDVYITHLVLFNDNPQKGFVVKYQHPQRIGLPLKIPRVKIATGVFFQINLLLASLEIVVNLQLFVVLELICS